MSESNKSYISQICKELRTQLGLTQFQMAIQVGVKPPVIHDWERGRKSVGPGSLIRMGLLAPPPLCWDFFEAAGLPFSVVEQKVKETNRRDLVKRQLQARARAEERFAAEKAKKAAPSKKRA